MYLQVHDADCAVNGKCYQTTHYTEWLRNGHSSDSHNDRVRTVVYIIVVALRPSYYVSFFLFKRMEKHSMTHYSIKFYFDWL